MRLACAAAAAVSGIGFLAATPASAQFFFQSKNLSGQPVKGHEPGVIASPMPDATPEELRAGLVWTMRAALNVAALQCQFEPSLTTVRNYNAMLADHREELKDSFDRLTKYFNRTAKTKAAAQTALDQFGTRTYSSFATVGAQLGFCQAANSVGRDANFAPRGMFGAFAEERMQELRNSLVPFGEQRFPYGLRHEVTVAKLRLDAVCWSKKGEWRTKKCGNANWPPSPGIGVAAR